VKQDGKRCATPLLAALVVVESSDIIFAVDSVPAVLSITRTAFVAYWTTSSCLEGLVDRSVYLHYGLAAILVFVGAKFMAQGFGVGVPILASLLVIVTAITVTIVASLIATRGGKHGEGGTGLGPSTHETDGRKRG
jgi:tellurite resistance protein TerC